MRQLIKAILTGIFLISISIAETYNLSLYFEQTEEALSTLFRAQVFPHPLGDHDGDDYDIYLCTAVQDVLKYKIMTVNSRRSWTGFTSIP